MNLKRILLIQIADIGDLITSTPAIAALREAHPHAHIALLASDHTIPVIKNTGLVDEIIPFERIEYNNTRSMFLKANQRRIANLRKGNYDAVIYLHHFVLKGGTLKFALIGFWSGAKYRIGLGFQSRWFLTHTIPDSGFGGKPQPQYWLDLVALTGADNRPRPMMVSRAPYELPPVASDRKRIVIHTGSGGFSVARRWPPEYFAALADRFIESGEAEIIIVGGPKDDGQTVIDAMQHTPLNLIAKTNLQQLADVIAQADLFIGADSGVMHLAAATGTPVLAIFGPSNHEAWGPWAPEGRAEVLRSAPLCSPCSYVVYDIGLRDGCAARTCMRMIQPEHVYKAASAMLKNQALPASLQWTQRPAAKPRIHPNRVQILGLPVDTITYDQWLAQIKAWVDSASKGHQVCTINPEFMMIADDDFNFRNILRRADLCVPDGVGLLLAARMTGQHIPQRVTGSDGLPLIAECAAREGWSLYLLGAAEGVAERTAEILTQRHPGLKIAGTYSGSPAAQEEDAIVERINASGADLLFVAYGAPQQDAWIARNLPRLNVVMAMGVGGTFDFITGIVPRAPKAMQQMGLEWLYRLYLEPRRYRRMLRLPRFMWSVLRFGRKGKWLDRDLIDFTRADSTDVPEPVFTPTQHP